MSFCDKMSSGIVVAVIQGLHRYVILVVDKLCANASANTNLVRP